MKQRVITAVLALALFIPVIWYGGWPIELVAAVLAGIGVYELYRMKGLDIFSFEGILSIIGAVVLVLPKERWFFFLPERADNFIFYYLTVLILLTGLVISKNLYTISQAGFPVIAGLYVGVGFQNFVYARQENLIILFYALFVVWATDIGAYFIGKNYGKNKLMPDVSPNKTIEGALGGIFSAVFILAVYLVVFSNTYVFPYSLPIMLILTAIFSVVGQIGDLVESSIKRHYNVKDSGNVLPGHGGILDRFDSLLFVFPVMHLLGLF